RIIGIAPLVTPQMDEITGEAPADMEGLEAAEDIAGLDLGGNTPSIAADAYPAFWIYFPEARHIFVNKEVASRHNDATGLSYDDVFIKRLFSSYIVKQSNPDDFRIKDYVDNGLDRLYEAQRIKKTLVDFEQDLWSY